MPRKGEFLPLRERLERNAARDDKTGCLVWHGARDKDGYGLIQDTYPQRVLRRAHRASFEEVNGPIPDGMQVCHRCDNPACIEPAHLFVGTNSDNQVDAVRKGRNAHQRVTVDEVRTLRRGVKRGEVDWKQFADARGLSRIAVYEMVCGKRKWRHVD